MTGILKQNYPQLGYYQLLADTINEQYYDPDYPDLMVRYVPNFKWSKGNKAVRKIGISATNTNVSASNKEKEEAKENFCGKFKDDILKEYGFTMEKDVSSSVPRLTLSLNTGYWISESIDIYKLIWERYKAKKGSTYETIVDTFKQSREAVKSLHMRGYFDSPARLGVNTRNAMLYVANPDGVDKEMALLREAIIEAEGYYLYDSEIFFHESNIYMEVLKELLDEGFFVWQCYDCWYAKKEGITQEEFEAYTTKLVEEKANEYIKKWIWEGGD